MVKFHDSELDRTYLLDNNSLTEETKPLEKEIAKYLDGRRRYIVFDMSEMQTLNSKSLAELLKIKNIIIDKGGTLSIVNPNEKVIEIIKISGLEKFLFE